jgi:indole-3-glycerol phosphate synthase
MTNGIDFMAAVVEKKHARLRDAQAGVSFYNLRASAYEVRSSASRHALRNALSNERKINVIAEIKRASPSKGDLGLRATVEETALAYSRGGAVAVSVLTEEDHFHGSVADLRSVRRAVSLPVLRKDFIFDDYQIYEAAAAGADALLLIVAILDDETLLRLRTIAETELGMDALVEVHTSEEMARASAAGASLIGVNNRNLHTFEVSIDVSRELRKEAPDEAILISESGLKSGAELKALRELGYKAFLIGEALVATEDPESALRGMIEEAEEK